jgi:hypothetical protein
LIEIKKEIEMMEFSIIKPKKSGTPDECWGQLAQFCIDNWYYLQKGAFCHPFLEPEEFADGVITKFFPSYELVDSKKERDKIVEANKSYPVISKSRGLITLQELFVHSRFIPPKTKDELQRAVDFINELIDMYNSNVESCVYGTFSQSKEEVYDERFNRS